MLHKTVGNLRSVLQVIFFSAEFIHAGSPFTRMTDIEKIKTTNISNIVSSNTSGLFINRNNTLWVSTQLGISQLSQNSRTITQWVNNSDVDGGPEGTIVEGKQGVWVACGKRLILKSQKGRKWAFATIKTFDELILSIIEHKDDIWVGVNGEGIYKINRATAREKQY